MNRGWNQELGPNGLVLEGNDVKKPVKTAWQLTGDELKKRAKKLGEQREVTSNRDPVFDFTINGE